MIEYVIDSLRDSSITTVVTTHSPLVIFLRHDSVYGMKKPVPLNCPPEGMLNGERSVLWLFQQFNQNGGRIPERIQMAMEDIVGIITCFTGLIFFHSFLRYMYRELFVSICTRYEIGLSRMSKNIYRMICVTNTVYIDVGTKTM